MRGGLPVPLAVNMIFTPVLVIILIFADYIRKYNTDQFQRRIFLEILVLVLLSMAGDFVYYLLAGRPGGRTRYVVFHIAHYLYYFCQVAAYYYAFLFIMYLAHKNPLRTRRVARLVWVGLWAHGVILFYNIFRGFYFYVTADHQFHYGELYIIRLIISYAPIPLTVIDILLSRKYFDRKQTYMLLGFALLIGLGSVLDLWFKAGTLVWPCFTAGLLYTYFFIIRSDSNIDSLTGIGNRYSFNEFIRLLANTNTKYTIVMIDMDDFKRINDTYGHPEGDKALREMALLLKGSIRHTDFAARYGGDEFVLAVPAQYDIESILNRLLQTLSAHNERGYRPYQLNISFGYDVFDPRGTQTIEEFLAHIDRLMYQHKERRKTSP